MVESEASGLTEEEMLNAVKFGHDGFVPVIEWLKNLQKNVETWMDCWKKIYRSKEKTRETFTEDLKKAFATRDKQDRSIKFLR